MRAKCSKCKTIDDVVDQVLEWGSVHKFCKICSITVDQCKKTGGMVRDFLDPDYGKFPISKINKNIIDARIARAEKRSPWYVENK